MMMARAAPKRSAAPVKSAMKKKAVFSQLEMLGDDSGSFQRNSLFDVDDEVVE